MGCVKSGACERVWRTSETIKVRRTVKRRTRPVGDNRSSRKGRMHDEKTVQRFIELRVQGWVFTRIAAELNVTRPR